MHAHLRVIGQGEPVPFKANRPTRKKKGPRLSLLRKIERLSHHKVDRFKGWCFAGNETLAADYDVEPRTIRRWFRQLEDEKLIETKIIGNVRLSRPTNRGLGTLEDEQEADNLTGDTNLIRSKITGEADIQTPTGGHSGLTGGQFDPVHNTELSTEYVLATIQNKISPGSFEAVQKAFVGVAEGRVMFLHLPEHLEKILSRLFKSEFI